MFSREGRIRLFLGVLVLVLVVVNSQSLQLSSESRTLLNESFQEGLLGRARIVGAVLSRIGEGNDLSTLTEKLEEEARKQGLRSACLLDWNARLVTGGNCPPPLGEAYDRLDRDGRRLLLENGWETTPIAFPYDVERAEITGYLVLSREGEVEEPGDGEDHVLRVVMSAPSIAEANRRFRSTLIYQVSALSLVLLAVVLFFQSLVAPHRRLVAEARTVATELATDLPEQGDEGQFLLETFQDVVARLKDKERELQAMHLIEKTRADETEALASDIIRSMTTGLVSLDPSASVVVVNPAAERIFGIDEREIKGRKFRDVFGGSPELCDMVEEALERGSYRLRGQARYRLRDNRTLHLGVSVIPLLSKESTPKGALCLLADLTEVVELRERLFLKENLARLGEMTAGIAHEFRNGLATIMGNARLLRGTEGVRAGEQDEIVEALLAESQSLARVVTEFLQFARPEPIEAEQVDLTTLAGEVLEELRPKAEENAITVSLEGDDVSVEGDEPLLRKALANVVSNAIEALSEARTPDGRVVVEVRRAEASALVRVSDNGPGIAAEDREKIFAPFFTRKERGTGLGLSVVQKVVVSHNGTVELETGVTGTSFLLRIPLVSTVAPEAQLWM